MITDEYDTMLISSVRRDYIKELIKNALLLRGVIGIALKYLTPRQQKVLELLYGLNDGNPKTYKEVANEFDVTRERLKQIEGKSIEIIASCLINK